MATPPDDDPPVSVLTVGRTAGLAAALAVHGFRVRAAADGTAGLAAATDDLPDVVVVEFLMTEMNGWEFVRRLRTQAHGHRPFVVLVSEYGTAEDFHRTAEVGANLHLLKPVSPEQVLGVLARKSRPASAFPRPGRVSGG